MPGPLPSNTAPSNTAPSNTVPTSTVPTSTVPTSAAAPGAPQPKSVWKTTADGKTIFRLIPPLVLWWAWIAFAAFNVADLVIQSHDWFSVQVTVGILAVTGIMYACALRPRVVTDAGGLIIRNPFRDYHVPWGGVAGVYLGDSVEIQCERPAPREAKTIYSWALYSPRRARARAELRVGLGARRERHDLRARRRFEPPDTAAFGRMPAKAKEIANQHPSHVMAGELARRRDEALEGGASGGVLAGRWAWRPVAAVLIPVAGLIAVIVAR
jgi:hypothetical protein